jgi:hypothetical protein
MFTLWCVQHILRLLWLLRLLCVHTTSSQSPTATHAAHASNTAGHMAGHIAGHVGEGSARIFFANKFSLLMQLGRPGRGSDAHARPRIGVASCTRCRVGTMQRVAFALSTRAAHPCSSSHHASSSVHEWQGCHRWHCAAVGLCERVQLVQNTPCARGHP